MRHELIRAGVSTNAPKEVRRAFLEDYGFVEDDLPPSRTRGLAFHSVTPDGLEIQTLDDYIRMVGEYLPDGKCEGIVFRTAPWRYSLLREIRE